MLQAGRKVKISSVSVLFIGLVLFLFSQISAANTSAVILQYHHVSTDTPSSTSVSPNQFEKHLQWLSKNNFEILPLQTVIGTLKKGQAFGSDKVVAITFDDANISVCETAWPILNRHKIPFAVFINTDPINNNYRSHCSWESLREMKKSGLMTPANHSASHLNMVSIKEVSKPDWKAKMTAEITLAQQTLFKKLGQAPKYFAYPYGEYNSNLASLVKNLGYIGFGQHSGAVGHHSDFLAIPRFPASGQYADLETLKIKLLSLPFPADISYLAQNPIVESALDNPPEMVIDPAEKIIPRDVNCFTGNGKPLPISIAGEKIIIKAEGKLDAGRHRYTCTSKSPIANRFYWISHQWLIE